MRAVPTLPAGHSRKRSPRALPVWLSTSRSRFRPVTATTGQRRLKFWGWGYEDQQPSHEEVREAAAGIRAHLGFTPEDAERPVSLEELALPEPRLRPPDGALGEIGAAAIPFGGGTSVVGGVEPRVGDEYSGAVTIDLRGMDRLLEVDRDSRAALIEAGATGPRLEEQLRDHGYTLRHFPQSFEYATLGGWIATRAG